MLRSQGTEADEPAGKSSAKELDEARLIRLVVAGDRCAFETLYRHYYPRLRRFLDRMTRSTPLVDEIVNDTMLVVWQKAHTYNLTSKVSTWIFAIAYRKALKALRAFDGPVEFDFDRYPDDTMLEPESQLAALHQKKILTHALNALPADQRTVVNLTYYHGMGYGEIAEIMDCPVNTVKTRMFHARNRLRTFLSGRMEDLR